ncbi:hypothetical protein L198_04583 [Cryptococcus wingfieldii CBS 7118]|uniref:Uncharacterized protein n=1 Tax=Cryptococcus wingfieldii CBS 7118 TaxID=1295528 RepID=A0A1E3J3F6_9TREE|nr:hypothetical protein L198_04583 [Cryptococcus wingfieldii CBS 7118]ODN95195.1 hypothetical protein L198_04583 [Cryptococcus wingfieldii CBS 7118]
MDTPTTSPPSAMKSPSRRSWFSFSRHKPNSIKAEEASLIAPDRQTLFSSRRQSTFSAANGDAGGTERLRPIQFSPNRIATLYVTPSERNLYLAAMSQLDQGPPPLPLWTDPAPALPRVDPSPPLDHTPPNPPSAWQHRPMSPKLFPGGVPHPGSPGLHIREEFRNTAPPKAANHALVALIAPGGMRFTGFPPAALIAVDHAISEEWPWGVVKRSEGASELQARGEKDTVVWNVTLKGKVWRRKGNEELDTVRLILSVFRVLGRHGWTLVESIQAGSAKKDTHNLLFSYAPQTVITPPAFFALSIPLPDRISLINPPLKSTPSLISALRQSILSASPLKLRTEPPGTIIHDAVSDEELLRRSEKGNKEDRQWIGHDARGIKLEGWVHDGVYRFWVDGMRRWIGKGIKRRVVENIHPMLVITMVNNFSSLHYQLTGSVPLVPFTKGRDVLIFQSLPSSGVSARDSYIPRVLSDGTDLAPGAGVGDSYRESVELLPPIALARQPQSQPQPPRQPEPKPHRARLASFTGRRRTASQESSNSRKGNVLVKKSSIKRKSMPILPSNTSLLNLGQMYGHGHHRRQSDTGLAAQSNHTGRDSSEGTAVPPGHSRNASHLVVTNATRNDRDNWSVADRPMSADSGIASSGYGRAPPAQLSRSRLSPPARSPSPVRAASPPNRSARPFQAKISPAPRAAPRVRAPGQGHTPKPSYESGQSVYVDAPTDLPGAGGASTRRTRDFHPSLDDVRIPGADLYAPSPDDGASSFVTQPLALGQPIPSPPDEKSYPNVPAPQVANLSDRLPVRETGSPRRTGAALVNVNVGRVESQRGSLGNTSTMVSSVPPQQHQLVNEHGYGGSAQFASSHNAAGQQGRGVRENTKRKVWDESRGIWVDTVKGSENRGSRGSHGSNEGVGSARTRVNVR